MCLFPSLFFMAGDSALDKGWRNWCGAKVEPGATLHAGLVTAGLWS